MYQLVIVLKIYLVSQNILLIFSYHVDGVDDVKALRVDGDQDVGVAVDEQRRQGPRWSLNLKMTKTVVQMIRFSHRFHFLRVNLCQSE